MSEILTIIRGDNTSISIDAPDYNFTGGTLFFTIKPASKLNSDTTSDDAALVKKSYTSFSNPTVGQAVMTLLPADTSSVTPGKYKYDVQLVSSGGTVTTLVSAQDIILSADVTRRVS